MPDAIAASVGSGQTIDALQYDFSSGQVVAVSGTAASSAAFALPYTAAVITATTNCWYSIGATAVAHGAASDYLPAGMKLKVKFALGATISVIQDAATGFLAITPMAVPNMPALLLDTGTMAAGAYSLRRLANAYTGPCINVRRSTDNATQNIGFAGNDFDVAGFNAFISAGQGFVATWYDQSGNGNNATQATAANQPQLDPTGVGGKPGLLFTQTLPQFLSIASAASINMPFLNGGYLTAVVSVVQAPTAGRRLWQTQAGAEQFSIETAQNISFTQNASTTNGTWVTAGTLSLARHQIDVQYSAASLSNAAAISLDAAAQSNSAVQQPVGTITSAVGGQIGGNGANAWPGYIAEILIYQSQPAPGPIRANQKAYWGTP